MKNQIKNNVLIISPEGRIDTNNAEASLNEIMEIIEANPAEGLVLDIDGLEYISSAGLRIVLKLKKLNPSFKIINARPEVYEIFDTTGFTEMMDIEKGYRQISVEGCEVIGEGANGTVYRISPEIIVKLFKNQDVLEDIERERKLARTAFIKGIPTAISFDIIKSGDKIGTQYELLDCKSISKLLVADPTDENIDKYSTIFVDLLKTIHSTEDDKNEMPDHKVVGLNWVKFLKEYLPEATWNKLYAMVEAIPESNKIVHGDYHTNNIMMPGDEPILIDMDTLSHGNPVFEFASIFNALQGFSLQDKANVQKFLGYDFDTAQKFYYKVLEKYFGTTDPEEIKKQDNKSRLLGFVRLMRRSIRRNALDTEEGRALIEMYKNEIIRLTDEVNELAM